eukprot:SAG31_NODE_3107_length_4667_cov_4.409807_3_plen_180_part_00
MAEEVLLTNAADPATIVMIGALRMRQVRSYFLVFVPTIREIRDFYREMQRTDRESITMCQIRSKASCEVATEMAGFGKNITMPSVNLSMLPSALPEVKPLNLQVRCRRNAWHCLRRVRPPLLPFSFTHLCTLQCLGATEKTEPLNSSGKPFPLPYLSPSETNEADYGAKWSGLTYSSGG